jgi:hypothetical protein
MDNKPLDRLLQYIKSDIDLKITASVVQWFNVLASSAVDRRFDPRLAQHKDY